ncbi:uncharacterized protein LOC129315886 [Prosopis cineraria]|uniref:uncharacterized protein LOC129315886 n=1 Tax=Prosopis cineraria TaxID=364024 RepID=UPI00240FDB91|nr:uncharacterized protein LOC129315886 [Prosopis cineraria]XP_054815996.1 uncharacterized protein LOC129315886 [Prosopis cineraria]
MGKEGDLWDDSALISAFDQAISTYKMMHISKNNNNSAETKQMTSSTGEIDSKSEHVYENLETRSNAGEVSSIPVNAQAGETSNGSYFEEIYHTDSQVAQSCLDSSVGQNMGHSVDGQNSYSHAQGVDDYNQLVGQYYELEERRQKILEQLNQYGGLNYQYADSVFNSGVPYSNFQSCSMSACHVSDPNVPCSCCPCCDQCLVPPCTSVPGCSLGGTSVGKPCNNYSVTKCPEKPFPCEDDKILKTAMVAAEKAMSTIKTTISGNSDKNEEKERSHSEQDQHRGMEMETDLTVVLNAWYSAGFFTGKFLTEKSIANRRQE